MGLAPSHPHPCLLACPPSIPALSLPISMASALQMDLNEEMAQSFYQKLLALEQRVRTRVLGPDRQS